MRWHDLLYFSKGEKRALTLLLSLIAMAWLVLLCTNTIQAPITEEILPDTIRSQPKSIPERKFSQETRKQRRQQSLPVERASGTPRKKTDTLFKRRPKTEKFSRGTIVELNTADTITLKKVPGIGSAFAGRIIKYRNLLGGFYTVEQLAEVYGIDEERYEAMKSWFSVDLSAICQLNINKLSAKELDSHPYISYSCYASAHSSFILPISLKAAAKATW